MAEENFDPLAADRGGRGTEGRIEEYPTGVTAASLAVVGYGSDLHGWVIRETAGAAAVVRIHDGRDNGGPIMAAISIPANSTDKLWLGRDGLAAETGLYLAVVSGSVEAVLFAKAPGTRARR